MLKGTLHLAGLALAGCSLLAAAEISEESAMVDPRLYQQVGAHHDIDPLLLQAIASVESRENPYALNVNHEDLHCGSRRETEQALHYIVGRPWVIHLPRGSIETYVDVEPPISCALRGHFHDRLWFSSEADATTFVDHHGLDSAPQHRNVQSTDIGLLQINWYYHGDQVSGALALLDPAYNLDYAARYLTRLVRKHGVDEAIGRYHGASSAARRADYQDRVLATYRGLLRNSGGLMETAR